MRLSASVSLLSVLSVAVSVAAYEPFRRWDENPCVDVENGARYCFKSKFPCHGDTMGECPPAGTHAEARCDIYRPSFHMDGPYEGRCVLSVDTVCVKRGETHKCVFPDDVVAPNDADAKDDSNDKDNKSHSIGVAASGEATTSSTKDQSGGAVVAVGAVGALAVVAMFVYRNRSTQVVNDADDGGLVTPAVPHPDEVKEYAEESSLTPTLLKEQSKICSV